MEVFKLNDMKKGWFIGDFIPSLFTTKEFEVGVKKYQMGDEEPAHKHIISTEFTVILNGEVEMSGRRFFDGDIVLISPGETTDFRALTDVTTIVVKIPGALNDKYMAE